MKTGERATIIEQVREKYEVLAAQLDERALRLWAASEARAIGWGGVSRVAEATGLTRPTVHRGLKEIEAQRKLPAEERGAPRVREAGVGRKRLVDQQPHLWKELQSLVDPVTRGDPMCPLRWTSKSTRKLAAELTRRGFPASDRTVAQMLHEMDYSQSNSKTREDKRGQKPSRPRCTVRGHQQTRETIYSASKTGTFGGHKEEGECR